MSPRPTWPAGIEPVPTSALRFHCPLKLTRAALAADKAQAALERTALEEAHPDAEQRARVRARRRLEDQPRAALDELVGQARAVDAIAMGLGTEAPGFHVFVCGRRGTGRHQRLRT